MSSNDHAERQAGAIILAQLKMFNEAMVVFNTQIEPAFWKGFDRCIARFAKRNEWDYQIDFSQNGYCWLAPKYWKTGAKKWACWFETYTDQGNEVNANLASITRVGVNNAQFGFCLEIEASHFGGAKKLEAHINGLDAQYRTTLVDQLKFKDLTRGCFFLPFEVNLALVTQCWQDFGEFPEDHDVFTPVWEAMEKLQEAVCTFDSMFLRDAKESKA